MQLPVEGDATNENSSTVATPTHEHSNGTAGTTGAVTLTHPDLGSSRSNRAFGIAGGDFLRDVRDTSGVTQWYFRNFIDITGIAWIHMFDR